jgi:hypothetical protein
MTSNFPESASNPKCESQLNKANKGRLHGVQSERVQEIRGKVAVGLHAERPGEQPDSAERTVKFFSAVSGWLDALILVHRRVHRILKMVKGNCSHLISIVICLTLSLSLQARKGIYILVLFLAMSLMEGLGCYRLAGPPSRQESCRHKASRRRYKRASISSCHRCWHRALSQESDQAHGGEEAREEEESQTFHQGAPFMYSQIICRTHFDIIKVVNYSHLFPTRYSVELEGLKGILSAESFKEPTQREDSKKQVKKLLEERYSSGKNKWFFQALRVCGHHS